VLTSLNLLILGQYPHPRNGLNHYLWVTYRGELVLINAFYLIETLSYICDETEF